MSLTRQEVFQALADGKTIELKNPSWADYRPLDHTNYLPLKSDSFNNYDWRIKPKPLEWYENIPSHGVLCWVGDVIEELVEQEALGVVVAYYYGCEYPFTLNKGGNYRLATPLTDEEIKQFLQGE